MTRLSTKRLVAIVHALSAAQATEPGGDFSEDEHGACVDALIWARAMLARREREAAARRADNEAMAARKP